MLGDRIRSIREDKKMGLNETADLAGISGSYLSNIENGIKKNPSMKTLSNIASALGVSVDDFFKDEAVYKPTLSVKEQEKLDAQAEEMMTNLRGSLSQNKGQLSEEDYAMLGVTIRAMLEQMTKKNKEKYTSDKNKKNNMGND